MERHKCKLCTRSFSSGRALGGHMKGHLAAHPLPHKTTTLHQLSDSNESASSSSSVEELDTKGKSQSPEVAEEKSLGYGLRNKPQKSFRFSDPEFSFAVDSGSVVVVVVRDRESDTESRNPTRKRSNRNRKLFDHHHQKKKKKKQSLEIKKRKLKKPSCCAVSDTSPEEDVAMCLMMLSRDVWMRNNDEEAVQDQRDNVEMVEESEEIKLIRQKCKKVFGSYGGHKKVCEATETKNAGKVNTDKKIFECTFCYKVFLSGQALGGHKRSHLSTNSTTAVVSHSVKFENNLIDLNLPAPLEDDDFSVVSYA